MCDRPSKVGYFGVESIVIGTWLDQPVRFSSSKRSTCMTNPFELVWTGQFLIRFLSSFLKWPIVFFFDLNRLVLFYTVDLTGFLTRLSFHLSERAFHLSRSFHFVLLGSSSFCMRVMPQPFSSFCQASVVYELLVTFFNSCSVVLLSSCCNLIAFFNSLFFFFRLWNCYVRLLPNCVSLLICSVPC